MSLIMMNVFQIFRAKSNLYSAQPQVYSAHQYFLGQKMTFFVFQPDHTICKVSNLEKRDGYM